MTNLHELPRHQVASHWSEQLDEMAYWMEPSEKRKFFETVIEMADSECSLSNIVIHALGCNLELIEALAKDLAEYVEEEAP